MAQETRIGTVTHYFGKVGVAAIELASGGLALGDTIRVKGHTTDFTMTVDSMQIDRVEVPGADRGQAVGIRVPEPARVGDEVYKVAG
ncbi:MAG: translation elongation factor-like protein [Candidatus Eisenbacteria bacterium]|uniref:Translation elongation factor-like protein n=1 Tax=Eiseniibacteriota bacterium TaxID=2212470 RepID=A0A937XAG9_UNCEI|nr:translation elongation factor-like protein [Candidatus Eisenbacteria bacterium]